MNKVLHNYWLGTALFVLLGANAASLAWYVRL
jgi:hypothetical protein